MKISELNIDPDLIATLTLKNVYTVNDFLASNSVDFGITAEEYVQVCQQIPHKFDFSKFPIFLRTELDDIDANGIYYLYNYDAGNCGKNYSRSEVEAKLMASILHTFKISLKPSLRSDYATDLQHGQFRIEPPVGKVRGKINSDFLEKALTVTYNVDYLYKLGINPIARFADGFYIWGQKFKYQGAQGYIVEHTSLNLNTAFFQLLLDCDAVIYTHDRAEAEYATIKFENARQAFAHAYENLRGVVVEQYVNGTLPKEYQPVWPDGITTDTLVSEIMTNIFNES